MENIYKYGSVKELLELVDPEKEVMLDTETSKLGSDIRLIQVYQSHWDQVLLFDTLDHNVTVLWEILRQYYLIGHNILYDFGCFKKDISCEFTMPEKWEDTFYALRLVAPELNTQKGFSLDEGLRWAKGYDPYAKAGLVKKELQMSFERIKVKDKYVEGPEGLRQLTENQLVYASIDVYELPYLWDKVKHINTNFVYILDKKCVESIMYDKKGLPLDIDKLDDLVNKDNLKIAEIDKQLPVGFNVNSYMQVRKLLGTVMSSDEEALSMIQNRPGGLTDMPLRAKANNGKWPKALVDGVIMGTIKVYTKNFGEIKYITSGSDMKSTSPNSLVYFIETSYKHSDEIIHYAKLINDKRKALKRLNFADRALNAVNEEGRIRGTFSPHAVNGRIQVDNENLSQYPRTMKSMWGHKPGNGRKLIYSDYAQVELRIICAALPEMNMYKALTVDKTDLHTFVGNRLPLSDEDLAHLPAGVNPRFIAKQCNFLLLYGGGESNFQRTVCKLGGVWFNEDITHKIVVGWKEVFSDIKTWQETNNKSNTNMDETVSGRPYKAGTVTDLNNIRVSGSGSEIFKLWLWYLHKYILTQYEDVYLVNRVHDSVIVDAPDNPELYKEISHKVALCAQKAWFEITKNAPLTDVPMPCSVVCGSNWEDLEYERNLDFDFELEGMYMYGKNLEEELDYVSKNKNIRIS